VVVSPVPELHAAATIAITASKPMILVRFISSSNRAVTGPGFSFALDVDFDGLWFSFLNPSIRLS
jgi:hypothetical protein